MPKSKKPMRTFTIEDAAHADNCGTKFQVKGKSGRFHNRDPKAAASKAFSSLCRRKRIKGRCVLYISVRETTQGSNKRGVVKTYRFTRRKVSPEEVGPFGNEYKTSGKAVKGHGPCSKSHKSKGRMFSRTAKGKTGKYAYRKSHSKSKSRRSSSKSKSGGGRKVKKVKKVKKSSSRKSKSSFRKLFGL